MENDVKSRFEESEKRYAALEKRFDDLKWYFGGVTTLFTIGFSILTVVLSWNYNSEKAGLREFQKDLKADLGKIESSADLELLGLNKTSLSGQDVSARLYVDKDGQHYLAISHLLRNKGEGGTGPMFVKIYTNDPIRLDNVSTDEPKFKYEAFITPSRLDPPEIPGKFSSQWFHRFFLPAKQGLKEGRYPSMIKVFYSKGRIAQASISLVISKADGGKP